MKGFATYCSVSQSAYMGCGGRQLSLFNDGEMGCITFDQLKEAYFDCRHCKRGTINALEFEMDWEQNCLDLCDEINEGRYDPRRSIAFVVEYPVKREIFAADFRDRLVHHLIFNFLNPHLEKSQNSSKR